MKPNNAPSKARIAETLTMKVVADFARAGVRALLAIPLACVAILTAGGCAVSYMTPSFGANMSVFTDSDIKAVLAKQPAANFPASIALARVQEPNYRSHTTRGFGKGRYSVVTVRDVETNEDIRRIADLPDVADAIPISRMLLEDRLDSDRPLRRAAAALHADMLLLYTFDTGFYIDDAASPLTVLTLGLSPHKRIRVVTTASAVLVDVRTGYVYGAVDSTARRDNLASAWTDRDTVDRDRIKTEREAFEGLLSEFGTLWRRVATDKPQHASASIR